MAETAKYEGWSVEKKLARARAILASKPLTKSGVNKQKYQDKRTGEWKEIGFSYFELSDFLPDTLKIFDEIGLCGIFRILPSHTEETGEVRTTYPEVARLKVVNNDDKNDFIIFEEPTAQVEMKTPIQSLGAKKTYLRRYLWIDCMEIAENDIVDAQPVNESDDTNKKQTKPKQQKNAEQEQPKYNQSAMAVEHSTLINELRALNIDVHEDAVANYIKEKAQVKSIDGGYLLTDLPAMSRVIAVMKAIVQSKK